MTEELIPSPEDSYGIAKFAVEQELHSSYKMFGLPFIIFRPHNVYGERQNIGDPYRNVMGIFMNQAMQKKPFTIFGDGNQQRAFSYISDVAPVIAKSIDISEASGETFNIGGDIPYTVNYLAKVISAEMNVPLEVNYLPARNEVVDAFASHKKACQYFGELMKNVSLDEGVSRMARWAKAQGPRGASAFSEIEVWKNMPPSWRAICEIKA
jgi:UDP-glucose 4-epimerase